MLLAEQTYQGVNMQTAFQKNRTDWGTFFSQIPSTFEEVVNNPSANRIDILITNEFTSFRSFQRHIQLDYVEAPANFNMDEFKKNMDLQGWIIREWEGGARLFKGELFPVRSADQILAMKRRAEALAYQHNDYHKLNQARELDLAFDL